MAKCKVGELALIIGGHCDCMDENIGKVVTCQKLHVAPNVPDEWWTVSAPAGEMLFDHPPNSFLTYIHEVALVKDIHLMPIRPSPEAESRDTHQDISVDDSAPKVKEKETA